MAKRRRICLSTAPDRRRAAILAAAILVATLAAIPGRATPPGEPANPKLRTAVMARIEDSYAVVVSADGARSLLPLAEMTATDQAWLAALAADHPLARGNSKVVTVTSTDVEKKTILFAKTEGAVETVQLCPPNVFRNQTASFCALYARIHWLDIAGYYVKVGDVNKVEGIPADPDNPWSNPGYGPALTQLVSSYVPPAALHYPASEDDVFEWIRGEVRKGRPVFAALTHEIWQALPPQFIAAHGWDGGKEGHAIVVNGFTWNKETHKGSFHIVNSWQQLYEFDLPVENAQDMLAYPRSLTPKGKIETPDAPEQVVKITLLQVRGSINIYQVETNLGIRKVAAPSEAAARALIEDQAGR